MTTVDRESLLLPAPRCDALSVHDCLRKQLHAVVQLAADPVDRTLIWPDAEQRRKIPPHALAPFRGIFPHLVRFSELVNLQWCGVRTHAAVYVASRLFAFHWRDYAPDLGCEEWSADVDAFVASDAVDSYVSALELVEIARVFRSMSRVKRSLYDALVRQRPAMIRKGAQLARDVFCVDAIERNEHYRIALFALTLAHADGARVPTEERERLAKLLGRYSFASAAQCSDAKRILTQRANAAGDSALVTRALHTFLKFADGA